LLGDYVSFLKQQRLRLWPKDCPEALAVRAKYKSDESDKSDASDPYSIGMLPAEAAANTMICLINQASYLIGRQIRRQEELFLNDGGFTERLYRARMSRRKT
jgi:four helix bundle suffix protein